MQTDMHLDGVGRNLFTRMMEALGSHFLRKPSALETRLEPLPTDALVRPSMHNRVTIQIHHEDWP